MRLFNFKSVKYTLELHLINFCCPGAMNNGGLMGLSKMEYVCGVKYSPLAIMIIYEILIDLRNFNHFDD